MELEKCNIEKCVGKVEYGEIIFLLKTSTNWDKIIKNRPNTIIGNNYENIEVIKCVWSDYITSKLLTHCTQQLFFENLV